MVLLWGSSLHSVLQLILSWRYFRGLQSLSSLWRFISYLACTAFFVTLPTIQAIGLDTSLHRSFNLHFYNRGCMSGLVVFFPLFALIPLGVILASLLAWKLLRER